MEQRHMQEKSRGAARPDVDARARAIQEQIIHIPRPAQPAMRARPPKARPDTLRAHSSVLLKRHAPGMTLAPSGGAQRRSGTHSAPRAGCGRTPLCRKAAQTQARARRRYVLCLCGRCYPEPFVGHHHAHRAARQARGGRQFGCFVGFSGCFLSGRRQRGADRGSGAWPCTANRRFVYTAFRFTGGAAGGGPCGYELL